MAKVKNDKMGKTKKPLGNFSAVLTLFHYFSISPFAHLLRGLRPHKEEVISHDA
jgi:hypothetical protein